MNIFSKASPPEVVSDKEVKALTEEESKRLKEERDFWDSIVRWADDTVEARRYMEMADLILEERRKRFPL